MTIILYTNLDPKNKIDKTLSNGATLTGTLRDECSITNPVIRIEGNTTALAGYNYMYITDFGRYYFITDVKAIRNNLWEVRATVDVLKSFAAAILAQEVILNDTQETGADNYINNDVYITKVKTKTDIVSFPAGLLEDGTFILITAGGIPTI